MIKCELIVLCTKGKEEFKESVIIDSLNECDETGNIIDVIVNMPEQKGYSTVKFLRSNRL